MTDKKSSENKPTDIPQNEKIKVSIGNQVFEYEGNAPGQIRNITSGLFGLSTMAIVADMPSDYRQETYVDDGAGFLGLAMALGAALKMNRWFKTYIA